MSILNNLKSIFKTESIDQKDSITIDTSFLLNDLLIDVYTSYRLRFKNSVDLKVVKDLNDVLVDEINPDIIYQIYHNFLSNAMKFTNTGEVLFGYEVVDGGIKIYVKDSGEGISDYNKEFIENCLKNPYELNYSRGFGLRMCKQKANLVSGDVGFESELNKGSYFWAYLPCVIKDIKNHIIENPDNHSTKIVNPCLLVAEDNDTNYELVCAMLKDSNYNITRAVNGSEAVKKCYEQSFDLVLMDIKMPIMDGVTAVTIIREFNAKIPIVACTANYTDYDRKVEKDVGFDGAIIKPFTKKMLFNILDRYFE